MIGCAAPTPAPPVAQQQSAATPVLLRVGMSRTMPPVAFKKGGKTIGLEADFAAALAAELGRKLQIVPVFWPELLIELEARRIDIIMSGMTITDVRKARVAFIEPYMTIGQMPLVRRDKAAALTDRTSVRKFTGRVGVEIDSTGQQWAKINMQAATITAMRTLDELVAAMAAGQIDMIIHDSPAVAWQARQHADQDFVTVPVRLTDEPLAWAVDRGNTRLRADVNAALGRWRASGRLERMIDKWIPADVRGATTN